MGKLKCKSYNVVSASSRKVDFDVILYTDSKDEEEDEIVHSDQTEVPMVAATRFGYPYYKNYHKPTVKPSQPLPLEQGRSSAKPTAERPKEKEPRREQLLEKDKADGQS